jgi:hypothetical protein
MATVHGEADAQWVHFSICAYVVPVALPLSSAGKTTLRTSNNKINVGKLHAPIHKHMKRKKSSRPYLVTNRHCNEENRRGPGRIRRYVPVVIEHDGDSSTLEGNCLDSFVVIREHGRLWRCPVVTVVGAFGPVNAVMHPTPEEGNEGAT